MKKSPATFDVVVVDTTTGLVEAVLGENMYSKSADARYKTALSQINIGPFFVGVMAGGTAQKNKTHVGCGVWLW